MVMEALSNVSLLMKDYSSKLYDDTTRPDAVYSCLANLGAERLLAPKHIGYLAQLSTINGVREKSAELSHLAAPYLEMAKDAEGRQELVSEVAGLAKEKIVKPTQELAAEKVYAGVNLAKEKIIKPTQALAAERVSAGVDLIDKRVIQPTKDMTAPYVAPYLAKFESSRETVLSSRKFEKALSAIKEVRERPREKFSELRSQAVDLLKYEELNSYREYILSEKFQTDTVRLVQVELPAIASDAVRRGSTKVKESANFLSTELDEKRKAILALKGRGHSVTQAIMAVRLESVVSKAKLLLATMQLEIATGAVELKSGDFSVSVALNHLKNVYVILEKILSLSAEADAESSVAGNEVESMKETSKEGCASDDILDDGNAVDGEVVDGEVVDGEVVDGEVVEGEANAIAEVTGEVNVSQAVASKADVHKADSDEAAHDEAEDEEADDDKADDDEADDDEADDDEVDDDEVDDDTSDHEGAECNEKDDEAEEQMVTKSVKEESVEMDGETDEEEVIAALLKKKGICVNASP